MPNHKPVKIMFDLDDPYHKRLYDHLKKRSNGSSYIRTLIQQDMNGSSDISTVPKIDITPQSIVEKEHHSSVQYEPLKININNVTIKQDDIFIDDLI